MRRSISKFGFCLSVCFILRLWEECSVIRYDEACMLESKIESLCCYYANERGLSWLHDSPFKGVSWLPSTTLSLPQNVPPTLHSLLHAGRIHGLV